MTASIRSSASYVSTATETGCSINVPAGVVDTDVLYLAIFLTASTGSIDAPSGWVPIYQNSEPASSTSSHASLFRRVASSEPGSYALTGSSGRWSVSMVALIGVDNTTPEDATASAVDTTAGLSVVAPSVSPSVATLLLSWFGGRVLANGAVATWAPDAAQTEQLDVASAVAATSNSSHELAYESVASGATGTRTAVASGASVTTINWIAYSVAVTPAILDNTNEGGSDTTTISPANSGGASGMAWDGVTRTGACIAAFSSAFSRGTLSAKVQTDATDQQARLEWKDTGVLGTPAEIYGRLYVYLPAAPSADWNLLTVYTSSSGGSFVARMAITTAQKLSITASSSSTGTVTIPTGQWVRLEYHIVNNATAGSVYARLYNTADEPVLASFDEELQLIFQATGTQSGHVLYGIRSTLSLGPFYLDDLGVDTTGWMGPTGGGGGGGGPGSGSLEIATLTAALAGAETGTGSDAATVDSGSTPVSASDTGTGADAATLAAALAASESGTGSDVASLAAGLSASDVGTGADAATVTQYKTASDTGTGSDTAALAVAQAATDAGTGADAATLAADLAGADTGTGADNATVDAGSVPKNGSDTGAGSDNATLAAALPGTEAGTGADVAALAAALAASDAGAGADAATLAAEIAGADAGTGADTAAVTQLKTASDTGVGADAATLAATVAASDTGTGADVASVDTGATTYYQSIDVSSAWSVASSDLVTLRRSLAAGAAWTPATSKIVSKQIAQSGPWIAAEIKLVKKPIAVTSSFAPGVVKTVRVALAVTSSFVPATGVAMIVVRSFGVSGSWVADVARRFIVGSGELPGTSFLERFLHLRK